MKTIAFITIILIFFSCTSTSFQRMQENERKFTLMLDSCNYRIVINNKELKHILSYEFVGQGCVKIVYPRLDEFNTAKWDTAVIGGNFGITKIK